MLTDEIKDWLDEWDRVPDTLRTWDSLGLKSSDCYNKELSQVQLSKMKNLFIQCLDIDLDNFKRKTFMKFMAICLVQWTYEYCSNTNVWETIEQNVINNKRNRDTWNKIKIDPDLFRNLFKPSCNRNIAGNAQRWKCETLFRLAGLPKQYPVQNLICKIDRKLLLSALDQNPDSIQYWIKQNKLHDDDGIILNYVIPRIIQTLRWLSDYPSALPKSNLNESAELWQARIATDKDIEIKPWVTESKIQGFPQKLNGNHFLWHTIKSHRLTQSISQREWYQHNPDIQPELRAQIQDGVIQFFPPLKWFLLKYIGEFKQFSLIRIRKGERKTIHQYISRYGSFEIRGEAKPLEIEYGDQFEMSPCAIKVQGHWDNVWIFPTNPNSKDQAHALSQSADSTNIPPHEIWRFWCANKSPWHQILYIQNNWLETEADDKDFDRQCGDEFIRIQRENQKNPLTIVKSIIPNHHLPITASNCRLFLAPPLVKSNRFDIQDLRCLDPKFKLRQYNEQWILESSEPMLQSSGIKFQLPDHRDWIYSKEIIIVDPDCFWISSPEEGRYFFHWSETDLKVKSNDIQFPIIKHPRESLEGISLGSKLPEYLELLIGTQMQVLTLDLRKIRPEQLLLSDLQNLKSANELSLKRIIASHDDQWFAHHPSNCEFFIHIQNCSDKQILSHKNVPNVAIEFKNICALMTKHPLHEIHISYGWNYRGRSLVRNFNLYSSQQVDQESQAANLEFWIKHSKTYRLELNLPQAKKPWILMIKEHNPNAYLAKLQSYHHPSHQNFMSEHGIRIKMIDIQNRNEIPSESLRDEDWLQFERLSKSDIQQLAKLLNNWLENLYSEINSFPLDSEMNANDDFVNRSIASAKILCNLIDGESLSSWRKEVLSNPHSEDYISEMHQYWDNNLKLHNKLSPNRRRSDLAIKQFKSDHFIG